MTLHVFTRGEREQVVALSRSLGGDHAGVPLVRLHSACLTGDILASMRCDCGPQLLAALEAIRDAESGALLYLLGHEGRGIGLVNKVRAYALQDEGADTVEANLRLGLPVDARDYSDAAEALRILGVHRLRLLTNNPLKVEALTAAGLEVVERVPHQAGANPFNLEYLRVKREMLGHHLEQAEQPGS